MKQAKEYHFKKQSIALDLVLMLMSLFMMLYLIINLWWVPLPVLLIGSFPAMFFFMEFYVIKIIVQFNRYDEGKKIVISEDRLTLSFIRDKKTVVINSSDVDKVEVYGQNSLGKFGTYNYLVIYTNNHEKLLITQFTIDNLINDKALETFLRKKPRFYFKKTFNYIDEQKFVK